MNHVRISAVIAFLAVQALLLPVASAQPVNTPTIRAPLQVKRGSSHLNDREGTIDVPVTYTNTSGKPIAMPVHIGAPSGLKNATVTIMGSRYVTLPIALGPGQSFEQIFRFDAPSMPAAPDFTPYLQSRIDALAGPPGILPPAGEYRIDGSTGPTRVPAYAGEEFVWDVDATNPRGTTLKFTVTPIPSPHPDIARASFATDATLEPVTGVFRFTPPAAGLYTARIGVEDGVDKRPSYHDLVLDVSASRPAPVVCRDLTAIGVAGSASPITYATSRRPNAPPPSVEFAPGRAGTCSLKQGSLLAIGTHPVTCSTDDGLWPQASCRFNVVVRPQTTATVDANGVISLNNGPMPNLILDGTVRAASTEPPPPGLSVMTVRNGGNAVARDVRITIPYPPEADRDAQLIRTGVDTTCTRDPKVADSPLICQLGDLAPGGVINVQVAFASRLDTAYLSPIRATVTTASTELRPDDNAATVIPGGVPVANNELVGAKSLRVKSICDAKCRKSICEASKGKGPKFGNGLGALISTGSKCDKDPPWMRYVITGVFAVGALVTGAGVVALANGAIQSVVFNATQTGAFLVI
jgi:hypothetical protein